jgi:hypothetical protein
MKLQQFLQTLLEQQIAVSGTFPEQLAELIQEPPADRLAAHVIVLIGVLIIVPNIVHWQDMVTVMVMVTALVLVMDMEPLEDILIAVLQ